MKNIIIKGAREHNLKNITVELPRDEFIVITGISGSGKSTLAFDTLYAEGQRRYRENRSLRTHGSSLGLMHKPDSRPHRRSYPRPSPSNRRPLAKTRAAPLGPILQRCADYLRLLFARIGTPYCPTHNHENRVAIPRENLGAVSLRNIKGPYKVAEFILTHHPSEKRNLRTIVQGPEQRGIHESPRQQNHLTGPMRKSPWSDPEKHDIDIVIDRRGLELTPPVLPRPASKPLQKSEGLLIVLDSPWEGTHRTPPTMACPYLRHGVRGAPTTHVLPLTALLVPVIPAMGLASRMESLIRSLIIPRQEP